MTYCKKSEKDYLFKYTRDQKAEHKLQVCKLMAQL